MLKGLFFVSLFLTFQLCPVFYSAGTPQCEGLLSEEPGMSDTATTRQSAFPVVMEFHHSLHPNGSIKLVELVRGEKSGGFRPEYIEKIIDLLQQQFPEEKIGPRDTLLGFNVLGEKGGIMRTTALRTLNRATIDMHGVTGYMVNHRVNPFASGAGSIRLVFVIKEGARDYRSTKGERLVSKNDFAKWLGEQLELTFSELFNDTLDLTHISSSSFKKAYDLLSMRPGSNSRMTKEEFLQAYDKGYGLFMQRIEGLDIFYLRPSFWDPVPVADSFAKEIYGLVTQSSREEFALEFSEGVSRLRTKLYNIIHRDSGSGRPSLENPDARYRITHPVSRTEHRLALSGDGPQVIMGHDFYRSRESMSLSEFDVSYGSILYSAINKLRIQDIVEMAQLNGANARDIMDRANLTIKELIEVGYELVNHGVYMYYPLSVYFRIPSADRPVLKHPGMQTMEYNPRTNSYVRRRDIEVETEEVPEIIMKTYDSP